ncbi:bactericidal permeability-increasing protein-like [Lytechinus variegatus]|uniref:bactericidal permeability-increasing protein-like n=1 Tax=Lytechinus variegatus TaxID=7654 RepID=UPI001BB1250D|nr:bactericidal permeability-increasing protein-like [Lytechinus variegatus]
MSTTKKIGSRILMVLVMGWSLFQVTNGSKERYYPKWKLAGWNKLPGFKARITQKGLDFFKDVGMKTLQAKIGKMHIPDQHGSSGAIEYSATNIKIVSFGLPASITPNGDGLRLQMNKASFNLHGDISYTVIKIITKSGYFDGRLADISLDASIRIGVDNSGRPSASAKNCNFHVGFVKVELHAGSAWKYDEEVAAQLKQTLNHQVCSNVIKAINTDLENKLRALKVAMLYKDKFKFDYSLVESPSFNTSVDTAHKGEAYPIGNATECPIPIPVVPQDPDKTSKMLFLWVTDYLPNSAGYVLQETGQLHHILTPDNVPPEQKKYLNTSSMAVKMLLPQISKLYPNMAMMISLNSTQTPTVKITSDGIEAVLVAYCSPYAILPNKTKAFLFTLSVSIIADLNVGLKATNITWKITSFRTVLKEVRSEVGPISISKLQKAVDLAIKTSILPKLNKMGMAGVPLPKLDGFEMINSSITPGKGFLKIGTDLIYTDQSADAI